VRLIFNENFAEKRSLWVLWIVHVTHWQMQMRTVENAIQTPPNCYVCILANFLSLFLFFQISNW